MFCKNCGKDLLDGAKFCTACGATQDAAQANAAPQPQPVQPQNPVMPQPPVYKKPKKTKTIVITAIISVILTLAAVIGLFALDHYSSVANRTASKSFDKGEYDAMHWSVYFNYNDNGSIEYIRYSASFPSENEAEIQAAAAEFDDMMRIVNEDASKYLDEYENKSVAFSQTYRSSDVYSVEYTFDSLSWDKDAAELAAEFLGLPIENGQISAEDAEKALREDGYTVFGEE